MPIRLAGAVFLLGIYIIAQAAPPPREAIKQSPAGLYVTAQEAYALLNERQGGSLFIDIRSREEVNFLGVPTLIDANVPYENMQYEWDKKKNEFKMSPNANFAVDVENRLREKGLSKDVPVILMCRSGTRSAKAAGVLAKSGFKRVYTMVDGYEGDKTAVGSDKGKRIVNGWRNAGLPWTYDLDPAKMYLPAK